MTRRYNILIVDDEASLSYMLQTELMENHAYAVDTAFDGTEAINKLQSKFYDVVLLDVKMPRVSGIEVLKFLREYSPTTQVIMLTNYADVKTAIQTIKLGAYDFISKPYDIEELLNTIERAIERKRLFIDNMLMRSELSRRAGSEDLVGKSKIFKQVLESVLKVAKTDTTVLIQGASGTGKELVAHLIHKQSERKDRPFVVVNCASIPDSLLESELFGHEKGAFTDAYTMKQGLVEVANRGTLFLDEIGDISIKIQPKLLRFVETGEFRRVGGNTSLHVGVRILSATNKDLQEEVKTGRFREDLLYRLNAVVIHMPLLQERIEDIPLLVEHFLHNKMSMKTKKHLSSEAVQLLMEYDWPGNIRELEHVIEGAAILSKGEVILPKDLMISNRLGGKKKPIGAVEFSYDNNHANLSLAELEKIHIKNILRKNNWSRNKTAETLGISQKTLYLKIKKYGIKVEK